MVTTNFSTNFEREVSFLVAQDAVMCGQRRRHIETFVDIPTWTLNHCKFCKHSTDSVKHVFAGECQVIRTVFESCKALYWMTTKERLNLDNKLLLYNKVKDMKKEYLKVKLVVIMKKIIKFEKQKLDKYKTFINNKDKFINDVMQEIRHQYMFALKTNAVYLKRGKDTHWCILY